jgi:glycosyltransferase involved in cell wall biosynthesis
MKLQKNQLKLRILAFFFSSFVNDKKIGVWGGERAFIELVKHMKNLVTIDIFEKRSSIKKSMFNNRIVKTFKVDGVIQAIFRILNLKYKSPYSYDVIYAYNNAFSNVISGLIASKMLDKPLIINIFHLEKYQKKNFIGGFKIARKLYGFSIKNSLSVVFIWPIIKRILKHAKAITVPSKATSIDLNSIGINQEKIYVIPLGLEHEIVANQTVKKTTKDIDGIFVGRISPNKGIFDTLKSWKIVIKKKSNAQLAVVNGKGERRLENFVKINKLNNNVILFDHLSKQDLSSVLFRSKLLIIPSYTEGFCFTVGKAMLHGVPVVSYDIPVIREVYGAFPLITFVRKGDMESLATEILNILFEKSSIISNMSAMHSKLLKTYSWNRTASNFYNILVITSKRS